jgi:hypothetical protein
MTNCCRHQSIVGSDLSMFAANNPYRACPGTVPRSGALQAGLYIPLYRYSYPMDLQYASRADIRRPF